MNNSTQTNTTDSNSPGETEADVQASIAAKNEVMTPEQRAAFEANAKQWELPTEEVTNEVNGELANTGIGTVDQDTVNAVVMANNAAGEHSKEEIADQVIASKVADEMMSGVSQSTVDNLYNQYGDAAVVAKNTIRDGAGDYGTLKTAGDQIGAATPPEQTADEVRAELTAKAQEGGLSTQEQATADVLGVEAENTEGENSVEDVENQLTELQEKMKADNANGVIQFEDVAKMGELKDRLLKLKMDSMSGVNPNEAIIARLDADINNTNESVAALEAQAKKIAELAEQELQQSQEQKAA